MKKIRNWKEVGSKFELVKAIEILQSQKFNGFEGPFAIKCPKTGKFIETFKYDLDFRVDELGSEWSIFVPDNDEEIKNNKIRELVKNSDCSGLNYSKIDNMTIKELWNHIESRMDNDQKYKMLLLYYDNKIYKTK